MKRSTLALGVCFLFLFVTLTLSVTCNRVEAAKKYEIATVVKITGIPWFNQLEEGVKAAAKEFNVNAYQLGPSEADPAQQVKIVEDLIAKGVDAICVVPNDATAMEPVFKKAQSKGIVVLTHESPEQKGSDWDIETIDNVKFGEMHFEKLAQITSVVAILQDWDSTRQEFLRRVKASGAEVRVIIVKEGETSEPVYSGGEDLGEISLMSPDDVELALAAGEK